MLIVGKADMHCCIPIITISNMAMQPLAERLSFHFAVLSSTTWKTLFSDYLSPEICLWKLSMQSYYSYCVIAVSKTAQVTNAGCSFAGFLLHSD